MRIGIVNDLALAREALRRVVEASGGRLAWEANDGAEGIALAIADPPDLILMDIVMPGVDGADATRAIMSRRPCPILVVTASVSGNLPRVYEALGAGALDAAETPSLTKTGGLAGAERLLAKIEMISKLRGDRACSAPGPTDADAGDLVAIGSSTGGPTALGEILAALPKEFSACIVIVQHLDAAFAPGLADWLAERAGMPVRIARHGDRPAPGGVLLAGGADHLVMNPNGAFAYTAEPADLFYRPAVNLFFNSLATHHPKPGLAVVLTGMGDDGAHGLLVLRKLGWRTIVQDEASSVVWGMPRAAAKLGAAEQILPLPSIGPAITQWLAERRRAKG